MDDPKPQDLHDWNRWFAVECNNHAWECAEQPPSDPDAIESMVRCAFASAWHWQQVGTPINLLRAESLLAWVHAIAGRAPAADRYTRSTQAHLDRRIDGITLWDRAFHGLVLALNHAVSGNHGSVPSALSDADVLAASLSADDRAVYNKFRAAVPEVM
ncbi:MAG: hypothetical protein AAGG38_12970 [Planctomycetota bacterium]